MIAAERDLGEVVEDALVLGGDRADDDAEEHDRARRRRTRSSTAATRAGARRRMYMPIESGTTVIARTRRTIPAIPTSSSKPSAPKCVVASSRKSGTVTTAATLEIAVSVIESAVSPRARWVSMFAITPPGEAPRITRPTASAGSRS